MAVGMYSKQLGEVSDVSGKDKLVSRVPHLGARFNRLDGSSHLSG